MELAFLRFMTAQGLEPMWYPHLTGGFPIGGLFFAQYFHAPAWITAHLPGFWSGEALRLVSVRHLLLLAAGHALFYASFRRANGLGTWQSYLLSFACVYHLRNLDALRYGAGIEGTLYGQAVVLLALLHVLGPSRASLAMLVPVSQLLLTCGYPVVLPFVALAALLASRSWGHRWRETAPRPRHAGARRRPRGLPAGGTELDGPHGVARQPFAGRAPDHRVGGRYGDHHRRAVRQPLPSLAGRVHSAFGARRYWSSCSRRPR
jgi:hypothetical protein